MVSVKWRVFSYRKNNRLLFASLIFVLLAFVVYVMFFDILIPDLPNGSYRQAVGSLFVIPSFMLAVGQAFILGFFLHMTISALNPEKKDFLKALFISSFLTFLFSLTYVIFPFYGPFYYIVFVLGPWYALPVEIFWSIITISLGALLIRRFYELRLKASYLISLLVVAGIIVTAS